mmetsp:Transcript_43152/g.116021  ORF Transcript_43152/g.116021 Transcript_43152/m.116021 type:complete len:662 (+) Transcript_43152:3-1988(+)
MPDYPRIALGVKGMTDANQAVLQEAGWHVVLVADWRFPELECHGGNKSCIDDQFIAQSQDSMEKLNIFRLPVGRVLYMDADTYVASGELNALLNGTGASLVPEGNIGMVPNGCNRVHSHGVNSPYSAGVMLFKPSLEHYMGMLVKAAAVMAGNATRQNDEQIINDYFENNATALDRKYNCMDPWDVQGADKCQKRCTEVVVSHFFGGPKPAIADEKFLSFVRKPSGPFEKCSAMNHGSCSAWSNFYCDLVDNVKMLTKPLQLNIKRLGGCCHMPAQESDPEDCHSVEEDCAETVNFNNIFKLNRSVNTEKQAPWFGNYSKTATVTWGKQTFVPDPFFHGGRPVYAGPNGYYLFYGLETKNWMVGKNIKSARAHNGPELVGSWMPESYAFDYHMHTKCPENTKGWKIPKAGFDYLKSKDSTIAVTDPNAAEVQSFESLAEYKKHKRFKILELKHQRAKKRRMAKMEAATEDETATADTTAVEQPKELEEAKAPTETNADADAAQEAVSEFKMVLDKTTGRKLGMKVSKKDGVTLQITGVTGDLVEQWNTDHPELAVYRGDSIVSVNGIVGDSQKLSEECKQNKVLELVVKRGQADSADEADETATADATTAGEVQQEAPQASSLVATRQKLEASLRALPSIPEVAAARQALEDELDYVNSKK